MSLGINTNIASLSAQRALSTSQSDAATAMQRLSTGLRINSAKDDAAGLAVSNALTAKISGLQQASRNASDAISMLQTAEGGMQSITDNLQRMRELAVQASSDSLNTTERGYLDAEVQQLIAEIERVADTTTFNGRNLLDGTHASSAMVFQIGANNSATGDDQLSVTIANLQTAAIGNSPAVSANATATASNGVSSAATTGQLTIAVGSGTATDIVVNSTGGNLAGDYKTAIEAATDVSVTVGTASTSLAVVDASANGAVGDRITFTLINNGQEIDVVLTATDTSGTGLDQAGLDTALGLLDTASAGTFDANSNLSYTGTAAAGTLAIVSADGSDVQIKRTDSAATTFTYTSATSNTASGDTIQFDIVNNSITSTFTLTATGTNGAGLEQADIDTQIATLATQGVFDGNANLSFTGTAAGGDLTIFSADGTDVTIARTEATTTTLVAGVSTIDGAGVADGATSTAAAITLTGGTSTVDSTSLTTGNSSTAATGALTFTASEDITLAGSDVTVAGFTAGQGGNTVYSATMTNDIATMDVTDRDNANDAIDIIDGALGQVNTARANVGAVQSRFESIVSNLDTAAESTLASRSRILDTDFAQESASLAKTQVLQQAGISVLAQANAMPQQVLALLQ